MAMKRKQAMDELEKIKEELKENQEKLDGIGKKSEISSDEKPVKKSGMGKDAGIVTQDKITQLLVRLLPSEKVERAESAASLMADLNNLEFEFDEISKDFKGRIRKLNEEIQQKSRAYRTGLEYQTVECRQVADIRSNLTWFEYRGEEYQRREMSHDEAKKMSQLPMEFD